jgi:hypothetical protein
MISELGHFVARVLYYLAGVVLVVLVAGFHPVVVGVFLFAFLMLGLVTGMLSEEFPRGGRPTRTGRPLDLKQKLISTLVLWCLVAGLVALVRWESMLIGGESAALAFVTAAGLGAVVGTGAIWFGWWRAPETGPVTPPPALSDEVRGLADAGLKVEAIQLLREQSGVGLAEAKTAVEDYLLRRA